MRLSDEFNWDTYSRSYRGELEQIKNIHSQEFFITDYSEDKNGKIKFENNLHPNWKEIYSLVYDLKPSSVFECGFGGCYHLKNISKILQNSKIGGIDLLEDQFKLGIEFSNLPKEIVDNLKVASFCDDISSLNIGKYEFVYSQAVVMHLSTINAINFLKNMDNVSSKYIFLMEGTKNHENFYDLIKQTLPKYKFELVNNYITNPLGHDISGPNFSSGILLTK